MRIWLCILLLTFASLAYGQTFDCFGGLITDDQGHISPLGSGGPHAQAATCSRTTTTVTCTVVDGTKYAIGEPMAVTGTGTALDWSATVCASNLAQSQAGGLLITNIVGNTLTLSSPTSGTVGSSSGTIKPLRWYAALNSGRVKIFDPLDHWLFSQQVVQATAASIAKYGSNQCNTAKDEFIAWDSLGNLAGEGFNSTGQSNVSPHYYDGGTCPSNNRIPFMTEGFESSYYSDNLIQGSFTGVSQPGKDMNWALDANFVTQGLVRAQLDFFDPRFESFVQGWEAGNNSDPTLNQSAWNIGKDHQDSGVGGAAPTNAGWMFNSVPTGKSDTHIGLLTLATSPHQTASANILYAGTPNGPNAFPSSGFYLYPDAKVYMKDSASVNYYGESTTGTPPATCDYTNISKICSLQDYLTAEYTTIGALNTAWGTSYTTFGSSETQVTAETFGTGTGAQTSFTHTFAHGNISPTSIQILVAGTVKGGDCPSFLGSCAAAGAGKGTMIGVNINGGTCTYATGTSCTMTFSSAPANGAAITVNYTYGGWASSTPGTGLLDEDGTHEGANGVCPYLPSAFANNHLYSIGDIIDVSSNTSWQYVSTGGTSAGSGTPTFSATAGVTATSGPVTFTSIGTRVCGSGGTYSGTMPNATMGADLEAWVAHNAAAYLSALKTAQAAVAPDLLNWGADQLGVWQTTPNVGVLKAANSYVDVAMTSLWDSTQDGAGPIKFNQFTHFYSGPLSNYLAPTTSQSAFSCNGNVPCFTTQQLKGQWWYTITNYWLTQVGYDGNKHGAVIQWTSNIDGLQSSSFGFETAAYNPYNTHDDVTASVSCLFNAFTCGSESSASWNGSDSITHAGCGSCIADATKLWVAGVPSAVIGSSKFNGLKLIGGKAQ